MHRNRGLESWVELAAAAVERARRSHGDAEVARRVAAGVSPEDYETTVRVLRTLGRDLQATGADLTVLDARLRAHGEHAPHVPEAPEDAEELPGVGIETNPQPTLGELPPPERGSLPPMEVAKRLARLRNPILPHPRRGRSL